MEEIHVSRMKSTKMVCRGAVVAGLGLQKVLGCGRCEADDDDDGDDGDDAVKKRARCDEERMRLGGELSR